MLGVSLSDGNGLMQGGGSTARDGSLITTLGARIDVDTIFGFRREDPGLI